MIGLSVFAYHLVCPDSSHMCGRVPDRLQTELHCAHLWSGSNRIWSGHGRAEQRSWYAWSKHPSISLVLWLLLILDCQKDGDQYALDMSQKLIDVQSKARKQKKVLCPKGSKQRLRQLRARGSRVLPFSTRWTAVSRKQKLARRKRIQLRLRNTQTMNPTSSSRQ